jgi:hypothetical protein
VDVNYIICTIDENLTPYCGQVSLIDRIPAHEPHWGPLTKNTVGHSRNLTECDSGSEFHVWYEQGFAIRQILMVLCQNSNKKRSYTRQKHEVDH